MDESQENSGTNLNRTHLKTAFPKRYAFRLKNQIRSRAAFTKTLEVQAKKVGRYYG